MDRPVRPTRPLAARLAALAAVGAFAGCTMCPDPYDYSGPVPNGSAPQNDFRARSGGILPIGAAACPWPPLVGKPPAATNEIARAGVGGKLKHAAFQEPTPAGPPPDEPGLVDHARLVETMSVLVVHGDVDGSVSEENTGTDSLSEPPLLVETDTAEHPAPLSIDAGDAGDSPAEDAVIPAAAPLAETPGWRSRR